MAPGAPREKKRARSPLPLLSNLGLLDQAVLTSIFLAAAASVLGMLILRTPFL